MPRPPAQPDAGVRTTHLDCGVPVLWTPCPGRLSARLLFRVGQADERLAVRGRTHLAEHLALSDEHPAYPYNGMVEDLFTSFDVTAEPDEVVAHLARVTARLHDLPVERLARELDVLEHEQAGRGGAWDDLRRRRFGLRGFGLSSCLELGLHDVQPDALQDWAGEVFAAGNAVLWLSGPPPAGLELRLPPGPRRPPPALRPMPSPGPSWYEEAHAPVAFTGLGASGAALAAAGWWLQRRLELALRMQRGLVYDVPSSVRHLSEGVTEMAWAVSSASTSDDALVQEVLDVLAQVRTALPPEVELAAWRREVEYGMSDPDAVLHGLDRTARALLTDAPLHTVEERRAALDEVTPEAAGAALASVLDSLLLESPVALDASSGLTPCASRLGPPVLGRAFVPCRQRDGGDRLVVGDAGVAYEPTVTQRATVLWTQCEAVLTRPDGDRWLIATDGTTVHVDPRAWASGHLLVDEVDRRTPDDRRIRLVAQPERVDPYEGLSGLASISTAPLVVLVAAVAVLTGMLLQAATAADVAASRPGLLTVSAVFVGLEALFVRALVRRLRTPAAVRTTFEARARSGAAVTVDQALARAGRSTLLVVAVASWTVALGVVALAVVQGVTAWPAALVALFAVRATVEHSRRRQRAVDARTATLGS